MKKRVHIAAMMLLDTGLIALALFAALLVRFDGRFVAPYDRILLEQLPLSIALAIGFLFAFRLYHRLWRYASVNEIVGIVAAVSCFSAAFYLCGVFRAALLPWGVYILYWLFGIVCIGFSRFVLRIFLKFHKSGATRSRVLIVGAGDAGAMIAREIANTYPAEKKIVGFVDDDFDKKGKNLFGNNVLGGREDIARIVRTQGVAEIIIAMPSVGGAVLKEILRICKPLPCKVKTVPGIYELIDGNVTVNQLRDVAVEDLLRRDPVRLDAAAVRECLAGRRVLVTGAGGSIGSELCRQILRLRPAALYLLGRGENSIYEIENELRGYRKEATLLLPVIADIRDKQRVGEVFAALRPEIVFHAAAHKHVPLMEAQPVEAVRNNIFGTKHVAEAARAVGAERFVMISTDKAVNPTNVMGASKRVAECIVQNMNRGGQTKFTAVRFGNVLGSRGSVLPLFKKQIARGGPLTVTDRAMKRYFMTIPEASQLVLQAGAMAEGGEVFVLDMGEPVRIYDMACDLIELSGFKPNEDIRIEITGLRPGEKLVEELLTAEEGATATQQDKVCRAKTRPVDETKLFALLNRLRRTSDALEIMRLLAAFLPTYRSERLERLEAEKERQAHGGS